jgi:hypothetical protein
MTRDDITRMAREAGGADITSHGWTSWVGTQSTEFLERFAALVAAAEREACAKVCDRMAERSIDIWAAALESVAENIRERGNT